ncbi:hypothetical protein H0H81_000857, partial [Sphagnurus paluster]
LLCAAVPTGQFAEVAYSTVPVEFLLRNLTTLLEPNFPLEGYHALQDVTLVSAFKGTVGNLPGYLVYRPLLKQLVVATSGTSSVKLALHDLRALKHRHPSERGNVHSGFWDLYQGVKPAIFAAVRKGFAEYDVTEIVITGHSMGGSISYLLCLDLLSGDGGLLPSGVALKLAVFGSPRTGDASLVEYWRELVAAYQKSHGLDTFKEYSVKAYNDGVPALPPLQLGYRHFAKESLYLDRTRLYHIPASESEHSIFSVAPSTEASSPSVNFPRGGHNYYNGRDFERLCRRIWWLANAVPDDDGWEDRYRKRLSKNKP